MKSVSLHYELKSLQLKEQLRRQNAAKKEQSEARCQRLVIWFAITLSLDLL